MVAALSKWPHHYCLLVVFDSEMLEGKSLVTSGSYIASTYKQLTNKNYWVLCSLGVFSASLLIANIFMVSSNSAIPLFFTTLISSRTYSLSICRKKLLLWVALLSVSLAYELIASSFQSTQPFTRVWRSVRIYVLDQRYFLMIPKTLIAYTYWTYGSLG